MVGRAKSFELEDPLSYLPRTLVAEYRNGGVIYGFDSLNAHVHLVIEGYVLITRKSGNTEAVMNLCQPDEFFGESSLVEALPGEQASAIGATRVMSWPANSVSSLILRQPELGLALTQLLACRCISLEGRITALSADSTPRRLAKALLHLAERMGKANPQRPDMKDLPPLSHQLLAQYIGATRAVVTHGLIQLRRDHLISYARQQISVNLEAMRAWVHDYRPLPSPCLPSAQEHTDE